MRKNLQKYKLTSKQKADKCWNDGYDFQYKKGWHIKVSWQAREKINRKQFRDFMYEMGWERNLYGMLRYH